MNTFAYPGRQVAHITLVSSPACHFCQDARQALAEMALDHPMEVTEVDARGPAGAELMAVHGAGMVPLVLLDGRFVSAGRLPRGKLRKMLAGRVGAGAAR